jgi:hypothetical protein
VVAVHRIRLARLRGNLVLLGCQDIAGKYAGEVDELGEEIGREVGNFLRQKLRLRSAALEALLKGCAGLAGERAGLEPPSLLEAGEKAAAAAVGCIP